ncbi:hypothetical protein M2Y35_08605, partial [Klebsiella pneumoniae]|nr:hypothetical protein [Klebsiella pneumoniae]
CVEQDDKGWDARKRAYCLKIQPATGSFARNLIYSTKPIAIATSSKTIIAGKPYFIQSKKESPTSAAAIAFGGLTPSRR